MEERIGMLLLLLRRICPLVVGNLRSCDIDMSSCVSDKLDESSISSSLFISSLEVKCISKYVSSWESSSFTLFLFIIMSLYADPSCIRSKCLLVSMHYSRHGLSPECCYIIHLLGMYQVL